MKIPIQITCITPNGPFHSMKASEMLSDMNLPRNITTSEIDSLLAKAIVIYQVITNLTRISEEK